MGPSQYPYIQPNPYQLQAIKHASGKKFIFGGNRSGKTFMIGYILALLAEGKYKIRNNPLKTSYIVWVSCLDYQMIKQTIIPTLEKTIPAAWLKVQQYRNEFRIYNPHTKIEIKGYFKSADSGRLKYQSASVDLIFLDEEHPFCVYKECMARTVDTKGQIITTMTPLLGMTWIYNFSRTHFHITMPTAANESLDEEEVKEFRNAYTDEKEIKMRLDGEFIDISGLKFLNSEDLQFLNDWIGTPIGTYSLIGDVMTPDENGPITIFDEPREGERYVIGMDIATGIGRDFTVATIYKAGKSLVEVLRYRSNFISVPESARIIYQLGRKYNDAWYMVEMNGVGIALKQCLEQQYSYYKVPLQINQNTWDFKTVYGYQETGKSRDELLNKARLLIQQRKLWIKSEISVQEWGAFQFIPKKKRYDHLDEFNDDCIFSDALAAQLWDYVAHEDPEPIKKGVPRRITFDEDDEFRASEGFDTIAVANTHERIFDITKTGVDSND